ncbi:trypsin-like serine protease [Enhygromyxa salina]|uniref:Trypsin-like protease n=1 Tax=Enhygromyxa salina TaxID=215803 RepID=A0A2S9Y6F0_9BACT|nr:trypsin-like serine protease [Enhygromyxa salina]PRQ00581.1 Trypsin-like protease precursor [Enhygromyxa salina]
MRLRLTQLQKLSSLAFLSFLLLPVVAKAGEPQVATPEQPPPDNHVWNGAETEPCAWPTVVKVTGGGSLCTGSLIHPRVVMYAAHCGAQGKTVGFGDSDNSTKSKSTEYCKTNPSYNGGQGTDWAYCVLNEPVTEIPITPVGFGCEVAQYYGNGEDVAVVGFGNNEGDNGAGRKRWGWTYISNAGNSRFDVGGQGTETICSGDSGGPAFIRYDDNSWHVYGIASTKNDDTCSAAKGTHSLAVNAVKWIEQDSGIDVTVCHDINGNWDPGPLCGNFFNGEPGLSYGSWNTWCEDTTALEWSATCGTDFGESAELNPPVLEVVVPFDGESFDAEPAMFDITVTAEDDSGLPVDVEIEIEGMLQGGIVSENPAVFANAVFYCGEYTIIAHGTDFWGNLGHSDPVTFTVEGDCMGTDTGDGDGDPGDGDGDPGGGDEDDGGEPAETGSDELGETGLGADDGTFTTYTCSCEIDRRPPAHGAWLGFGLLGLGLLRRRR